MIKNVFKWIAFSLLATETVSAMNLYFARPSADAIWNNTANWNTGNHAGTAANVIPGVADSVRIVGDTPTVLIQGSAHVHSLTVGLWGASASLTVEASGNLTVNGTTTMGSVSAGSFTSTFVNQGSSTLGALQSKNEATLISNSGTLTVTNNIQFSTGTTTATTTLTNTGIINCSGTLELAVLGSGTLTMTAGNISVGSLTSTAGGTGLLNIHGGTFTAGNILGFDLSAGSGFTIDIQNGGVLRIAGSSQAEADQLNALYAEVGSITSDEPLFAVYNLQTDMTTLGPATALDLDPPTPNPAGFTSQPLAISSSEIWMTAEGSDASGWIQYLFTETSGNPGATSSGWQRSSSYTDGRLSPDTQYSYSVTMRDAFGNTSTVSSPVAATTLASDPPGAELLPYLSGKVVAIWSKGAEQFVRSSGVDDGVLRADRKSYEANGEGRFLCFAEVGDTMAVMDMLLDRYVTHVGGKLASAVSGDAATRRFTLEDQGNHYYAIKADNGRYVRVDGAGELLVDALSITDDALFAIVPIRTGPNVVVRAYNGDDPNDQLPTWPNEASNFCDHPDEFPVNKVNIGMLQMTPILYSDSQFTDMRAVWNTNQYEAEFILPFVDYSELSMSNQVDALIGSIKRMEGPGYTFDYVILYHEILADLPGGPWSDPRISSQEEIDLFRSKVTAAYNAGEVNYPYYKVFAMPYQFEVSLMGFGPYTNTAVGCDAETLEFIKNNFDGMFLEVNGHDYTDRDEHLDAAAAAVWCRDNGLEFGITSGALDTKDTRYKGMNEAIFAAMDAAGFDKSWDKMHYVLHHAKTSYGDALPEWVANTTTENAKWMIEQVMPFEAPSIAALDTDGDGVTDLEEVRAGTPALALAGGDYDTWAGNFAKADLGEPGADYDGDGVDNLMEYALGGSPIKSDAASSQPVFQLVENYFVHVHNERTDDTSLTYTVQWTDDLVNAGGVMGWETDGVEFVDESAVSDVLKAVTNQIPTLGKDQQFIRVKIEQE